MSLIKLDIVVDVVCPWCAIGYKRLERAMAELAGELEFQLDWHPFELNPDLGPEGEDAASHLMRKYGLSEAQLQQNQARIAELGQELGFEFQLGARRIYNTFDAHRAICWAREQGRASDFGMALFTEYFTHGRDPSDHGLLQRVAGELGLDAASLAQALAEGRYAQEVRAEEAEYSAAGVRAVPAFIIDQRYLISGAQEPATLVDAFRRIAAEG